MMKLRSHVRRTRRCHIVWMLLLPVVVLVWTFSTSAPAPAADMTIHVTSPRNKAVVPRTFTVRIATNVAIGPPDTGRHHIHLYWDGERAEGKYDIVYTKTFRKKGLAPGVHHLDAVIANADHSTTSAHQKLEVTVRKAAATAGSGRTSTTTPANGGY
jgi:hypothetical protein